MEWLEPSIKGLLLPSKGTAMLLLGEGHLSLMRASRRVRRCSSAH